MTIANDQTCRLYQIDRSASVIWRYTGANRNISANGHTWLAIPISDDGVRMTGETSADTLMLTMPLNTPVSQLFRATSPSEEIFVTIYDHDVRSGETSVAWVGNIGAREIPQAGAARMACVSLSASMQREGLRLTYQRSCPHSVYDGQCRAEKTLHAVDYTVTGKTGTAIQINGSGDLSRFRYGAVEWAVDGTVEMRGIENVTGSAFELLGGTDGVAIGQTVTAYPGCDGLRTTCNDRFDNLLNHGGFPHMPGESIYGKRLW